MLPVSVPLMVHSNELCSDELSDEIFQVSSHRTSLCGRLRCRLGPTCGTTPAHHSSTVDMIPETKNGQYQMSHLSNKDHVPPSHFASCVNVSLR